MEYSIKPEEHEVREARRLATGAVEESRYVLEKEGDLDIHLAWEGRPKVIEEMNGVQARTVSGEVIILSFNAEQNGWKEQLKRNVAHEFAHAYFYEVKGGLSDFIWQWLLEEALAQQFAERIYPDIGAPQREAVDREELEELWPGIRERLAGDMDYDHEIFFGSEEIPRWTGYSLAYIIGRHLLQKHELEEFADLTRSDVRDAGDRMLS